MSAELLREAAAKIRSTARRAQIEYDDRNPGDWGTYDPGEASDEELHIVLWSPTIALIVANMLEEDARLKDHHPRDVLASEELARLVLGED